MAARAQSTLGGILVLAGIAIGAAPAIGGAAKDSPPPSPVAIETAPSNQQTQAAELSESERERAIRLVTASPKFRHVIDSRQYKVVSASRWTSADGDPVGVLVRIRLSSAATIIDREWPHRDFEAEKAQGPGARQYRSRQQRLTAHNVRDLAVLIDLTVEDIVQMMPEPNPVGVEQVRVELPSGASIPPGPREGEEGDR